MYKEKRVVIAMKEAGTREGERLGASVWKKARKAGSGT